MKQEFHIDLGHFDLGHIDLGHFDLGHFDLGHFDLGHIDLGHFDFGHFDLGHFDWGHFDLFHNDHLDFGHGDMHWDHCDSNLHADHYDSHTDATHIDLVHIDVPCDSTSQHFDRLAQALAQREGNALIRHQQMAQAMDETLQRLNAGFGHLAIAVASSMVALRARINTLESRLAKQR